MSVIKKLAKKIANKLNYYFDDDYKYVKTTFSQNGEDSVLLRIFDNKNDGFYVDIGAFHPICYSNTYALYKKGWRGINIDATPGSMFLFNKIRPRDINIETGISPCGGVLLIFICSMNLQ